MHNLGNNILFFFSSLGAFNGLILGIYLIFLAAKRNLSTIFLGALLLALSIRIGKSVAYFFDYNLPRTILQIGLTACTFIGPFLYFFIKAELNQTKKLPKSWKQQLLLWSVLILVVGMIFPYETNPYTWTHRVIPAIYLQWGVYVGLSIALLAPAIRKLFGKEKLKPFEKWQLTICGGVAVIYIAYVWAYLGITKGSYITGPLYFSMILYLMVFILLYRKKTSDLSAYSVQKDPAKKLSAEEAFHIGTRLEIVMLEKELFKNPNLKLNDLAKEIQVTGHQLSQYLNNNLSKNFTQYVNEYRIEEACKILSAETNLSIDGVSFEVGFNSKSTFFSTFKKLKGMTPSAWQQSGTAS